MSIVQGNDPYTQPSFSLRNRIGRALWQVVWLVLFRTSPRPLHGWRNFLLRIFGASIGRHVHVYPSVKIWAPWNLVIGDYVGVGDGANLYCMGVITIGEYATVSQGAHLCAGSHDFNTPNFQLFTKPITIGSKVWLCADSFVGPGVAVAEGSVIGARGVVSKSIDEAWYVWAGNPIRKIKSRDKIRVLASD